MGWTQFVLHCMLMDSTLGLDSAWALLTRILDVSP